MTTNRRASATQTHYRTNQNITYIHGSAAPKYETIPQRRPRKEAEKHTRQRTNAKPRVQAKPSPVNVPVLLLTLAAFAAIGVMMIQFISLSSEISAISGNISGLERELSALKAENDEYYSRIMSSVNLEDVREVAIMDLGMVYATQEQIITYDSKVDDYVQQSRVVKD